MYKKWTFENIAICGQLKFHDKRITISFVFLEYQKNRKILFLKKIYIGLALTFLFFWNIKLSVILFVIKKLFPVHRISSQQLYRTSRSKHAIFHLFNIGLIMLRNMLVWQWDKPTSKYISQTRKFFF